MPRFFVEPGTVSDFCAVLTGENAAHCRVLRLNPGETVTLCDGQGVDYRCRIRAFGSGQVELEVLSSVPSQSEAAVDVAVYMAFAKADKLEHVIQKATELGAKRIVAYPCSRCVSHPDAKSLSKKLERWQKIAEAAAKQSGRGVIPRVSALPSYADALAEAAQAELPVFFYENAEGCNFSQALAARPFQTASLMTGPEGGYAPEEAAQAAQAGLQICSLGSRILRCETAPLCALSALMFHCGEF